MDNVRYHLQLIKSKGQGFFSLDSLMTISMTIMMTMMFVVVVVVVVFQGATTIITHSN